jgi:mono/diheme cytochrome c family protein
MPGALVATSEVPAATQPVLAAANPPIAISAPAVSAAPPNLPELGLAPQPQPILPAAPIALPSGSAGVGSSAGKAEKLRMASQVFQLNCIVCHGPDGRGAPVRPAMPTIPDFTARDWQTAHGNAQMAASIMDGKGLLMPAWRGRVDPQIVPDLVAYLRSFGPANLLANEPAASEFSNRYSRLRQQWAELDQQLRALPPP